MRRRAILSAAWVRTAARLLRPRGSLTLIWRADGFADVLAALAPALRRSDRAAGTSASPEEPAIRVIVNAVEGQPRAAAVLPGLVLNDAAGRPTVQAEAILRDGTALPMQTERTA